MGSPTTTDEINQPNQRIELSAKSAAVLDIRDRNSANMRSPSFAVLGESLILLANFSL
jgi:hypothetical protein